MTRGTFRADTRELDRLFAAYEPSKVEQLLVRAARAGANAARPVFAAEVPVGSGRVTSSYYRRQHLGHGTLRGSVKVARIRARRTAREAGFMVGPMGPHGFTRTWSDDGTSAHTIARHGSTAISRLRGTGVWRHPGARGHHWARGALRLAVPAAQRASEDMLRKYAEAATR